MSMQEERLSVTIPTMRVLWGIWLIQSVQSETPYNTYATIAFEKIDGTSLDYGMIGDTVRILETHPDCKQLVLEQLHFKSSLFLQ